MKNEVYGVDKVNTGQLMKNARRLKNVNAGIIEKKLKLVELKKVYHENSLELKYFRSALNELLDLRHFLRLKVTSLVICDPFDDYLQNLFDWEDIGVNPPKTLPRTFKSYEKFNSELEVTLSGKPIHKKEKENYTLDAKRYTIKQHEAFEFVPPELASDSDLAKANKKNE